MKPTQFKESNTTYAKNQPEYLPLPVLRLENGQVTSCWRMTWKERIFALFSGRIFFTTWTFNNPLQPQRPHFDLKETVKFPDPRTLLKLPVGGLEIKFKYSSGEERNYFVEKSVVSNLEDGASLRIEIMHPRKAEVCLVTVREPIH